MTNTTREGDGKVKGDSEDYAKINEVINLCATNGRVAEVVEELIRRGRNGERAR